MKVRLKLTNTRVTNSKEKCVKNLLTLRVTNSKGKCVKNLLIQGCLLSVKKSTFKTQGWLTVRESVFKTYWH